jgi:hypothetical protein
VSGTTALLDNTRQLLHLALRPQQSAQPLLGQFTSPLILRVPQQLHHPSLVRRESSNLPNDRSYKLGLGRLHTLALAGTDGFRDGRSRVAVVLAYANIGSGHNLVS